MPSRTASRPRTYRSATLVAVTVGTVLTTLTTVLALPSAAATPSYVALGDSYSSGTGTRSYLADGTTCQRSVRAYPALLAAAAGLSLTFRACSGATVPDVAALQLSALSSSTDFVTVSVGGNDAGFTHVLTACALPRWAADCDRAIDRAESYVRTSLPRALATLYASVRSAAPSATVAVVGYPRLFDGTDCNALTWFSPHEMQRINDASDLIDATTREVATAAGFAFVDPRRRFLGHAVCDSHEWINGLSDPLTESYHPKRRGHRNGYLPRVSRVLTGTRVTASAATVQAARESAGRWALQERAYAERDRVIEPESFPLPSS